MHTTKIIEHVPKTDFKKLITERKNNIHVSSHALFHLNNAQRKIYNEEYLIKTLLTERIYFAGLQQNGCYAAFYKRKDDYLKIIIEITHLRIEIVTFLYTKNLPNLERL